MFARLLSEHGERENRAQPDQCTDDKEERKHRRHLPVGVVVDGKPLVIPAMGHAETRVVTPCGPGYP